MPFLGVAETARAQAALPVLPTARAKAFMALFDLRYPIVQAPAGGADLAAAISNAGGLGHIALWGGTQDTAAENVSNLRKQTKRPFVVNYVLSFEPRSLPAALDAGAPIVQFSWGVPNNESVAAIRRAGAKFGVQVGTVIGARAAVDAGADYLVAQGNEAGGHVQSSTPIADLLPLVLREAANLPVLTAGGVSTGHKLRERLLAGAAGAVIGTRLMATEESSAHPEYKRALTAGARVRCRALGVLSGWLARRDPPNAPEWNARALGSGRLPSARKTAGRRGRRRHTSERDESLALRHCLAVTRARRRCHRSRHVRRAGRRRDS